MAGTGMATFSNSELPIWLREHSIRILPRMYSAQNRLFHFRIRKEGQGTQPEGLSRRYTAITLIGLAEEGEAAARSVTGGVPPMEILDRIKADADAIDNLGDLSLILWAAQDWGMADRSRFIDRIMSLDPVTGIHPTVELSWTLRALCGESGDGRGKARRAIADRLKSSFDRRSSLFPHMIGSDGGARGHVSCFADLVYPVQALSRHFTVARDQESLDLAAACAGKFCEKQGDAGQWCWHYDYRTGDVIESYPVYAIHQDAMGPMALFALQDAGGPDFSGALARGLDWLISSPELGGSSLIDTEADVIWRKVARKEPAKLSRYAQAIASGVHPSIRVPGLDAIFPAEAIDFEDRPYHLGWLLHAWPEKRAERWNREGRTT